MRGIRDSEPDGIAGDVFWVLGMYDTGGGVTTGELHRAITAENSALDLPVPTASQVHGALNGLAHRKPPLVSQPAPGRWTHTGHGGRMVDCWCGEDGPARAPCGLGWPP